MVGVGQIVGGIPRIGFGSALKRAFDYLDYNTTAGVSKRGALVAKTGLAVSEAGAHALRVSTFTFTNCHFALIDNAGVGARKGVQLYDFPAGNILVLGATANIALTKSSAGINTDWDGDFGVGTAVCDSGATLSSTEQNIIPTTATPQAVAGVSSAKGINAAAIAPLDGTATAIDLFLNMLVDDADQDVTGTPGDLILNGTLVVTWINLGDK